MNKAKILMLGTHVSTMGGIASVVRDYIDSGLMSRLNIEYVATHRDGSKLTKIGFFIGQVPKVILKSLSADIVHIHTSHGWSFRRLAGLLFGTHCLGKKTILHVHGSQFDTYYNDAGKVESAIIRYGLRTADVVVALSQDWQAKLLEMEPSANIIVIRNAVDNAKYQHLAARHLHSEVNVLFLGRLGQRKGVYDLLDSMRYLDNSAFELVLAGDGDVDQIRQLVVERDLEASVRVPGWAGPEEKSELLRNADLYVLPSYHEGLPISILEAMSAGLPVISTPVGGIPEAVIDGINGYLVPPGDPEKLAQCIQKATADQAHWKQMSQASHALAKDKFNMTLVEGELRNIYDSLSA